VQPPTAKQNGFAERQLAWNQCVRGAVGEGGSPAFVRSVTVERHDVRDRAGVAMFFEAALRSRRVFNHKLISQPELARPKAKEATRRFEDPFIRGKQ